jgi:mannose-6-phosphate isomerase-like protein (cupin superfamily)
VRIQPIRRVVTGHDDSGQAVVISDGPAGNVLHRSSRPGFAMTDLWHTDSSPADMASGPDPAGRPVVLKPPAGGTVFRVVQFDPEDPELIATIDGAAAFAAMGAAGNVTAGARHPYMHRTDSVDYAVILSGSITMLLDDEDVELRAGDVVVQRGTNHAWANRGTEPCLIAFVLVDASAGGQTAAHG